MQLVLRLDDYPLAGQRPPRLMEWEHAVLLVVFGFVLLMPGRTLTSLSNEGAWGGILLLIGVARLLGLIVNGYRQRVTAWVRAVSAIGSSLLFMLIGIGYLWHGGFGVEAAFFPVIAVFELFNYSRAMHDVGRAP